MDFNWFNNDIKNNEKQMLAVKCILNKTSAPHPYLIFGPPGTGKTMTIIEAVKQIHFKNKETNILICAPSNDAANEITLRLIDTTARYPIKKCDLLRYFSPRIFYKEIPEQIREYSNFDKNGYHYFPSLDEFKKFKIVICTLITAGRLVTFGVPHDHFSYVFIDESGHATETEILVPIAGLISSKQTPQKLFAQVVLAGDPQQLGPIIHSKIAKETGFGVSMLERLITRNETYQKHNFHGYNPRFITKLLKNYRSHPVILNKPNEMFYDNELIAAASTNFTNLFINSDLLENPEFPMIFHAITGNDQREESSPSFFNTEEVDVVMFYLEYILNEKFKGRKINQEDIGIITPYRKQVQKLKKACNRKQYDKVSVGCVEQFQGKEKLIIIMSTVRSKSDYIKFDLKFHLGFLSNPKRLNVAITRPKALLIIIGNPNALQKDPHWRTLIRYCKENSSVKGEEFELIEDDNDEIINIIMNGLAIADFPEIQDEEVPAFARGNL